MYLFIGGTTIVRTRDIVGIFDLDSTTVSGATKDFLRKCESDGLTDSATIDVPRSFILTAENEEIFKIQFSQISSATLASRTEHDLPDNLKHKPKQKNNQQ